MAESWQTIEQAAVSLRLSVRTVNRHIVAGKLQSRLTDGRREVLVNLSDHPSAAAGHPRPSVASPFADGPTAGLGASAAVTDFADTSSAIPSASTSLAPSAQPPAPNALTLDQETVLALADNAAEKAEMAVAAYQALARLSDIQAQQVRRSARFAWGAVAAMAVIGSAAIAVMTHRYTRVSAERDTLAERAAERAQAADKLSADREALRVESESKQQALRSALDAQQASLRAEATAAREQAARSEGRLAAFLEQEQARQTRDAIMAAGPDQSDDSLFSRLTFGLPGPSVGSGTSAAIPDRAGASDDSFARASVGAAALAAGSPALATSQPTVELVEKADTAQPKQASAVTRPATSRRKARAPARRSATPSDTTSASTTDER